MLSWKVSLRYIPIFSFPMLVIVSFCSTGWMTYLPMMEAFVLIPLIELVIPPNEKNYSNEEEELLKNAFIFDFWVYLAAFFQISLLTYFLVSIGEDGLSTADTIGRVSAMGLMCGVYGINIAHELGHRPERYNHLIAKVLLLTSLYMHFFVEHNRGHHRNVSTPMDPATSRKDELLYSFWVRSIIGSYLSAWRLERARLSKKKLPFSSSKNEMINYHFIQGILLAVIYFFFGTQTMLAFIGAATIGILLLETVNYIEHYGLMRKEVSPGIYERVKPVHSWNSDHLLGRMMLFELSRHSDHHYMASRRYQILRHLGASPQMPTGYPGMVLMALVPPLWFVIMNRRIQEEHKPFVLDGLIIK